MKVLFKDEEENLAVMTVTKAVFVKEAGVLHFSGTEDDFAVQVTKSQSEAIVRELYSADQADVTGYAYCKVEFEVEDDEEEDFDDFLDDLEDEDEEGFRLPHQIAFGKKQH